MRIIAKFGLPVVGIAAALLMGTAPAAHAFAAGCMSERLEIDVLFDNVWHGGDAPVPEYGCDFDPDSECEWGPEGSPRHVEGAHYNWEEGTLAGGGHFEVPGGSCSGGDV
jgi:hypothetical protein